MPKKAEPRELDELGRVTFPSRLCEELGWESGDEIEIFLDKGRFRFKKSNPENIWSRRVGIARKLDGLHRYVLPKELLKSLGWRTEWRIDFATDKNTLVGTIIIPTEQPENED